MRMRDPSWVSSHTGSNARLGEAADDFCQSMNDMVALRSILCPVDFSEQSRHALRWARALARRTKGRLTVVSAVDPLLAEAATLRFGLDLAHAETEPALREFGAATWSEEMAEAINANFDVQVGNPADVILETAAKERSDLIVMGTHGLGGVGKWLLGSTTERVLRRTHTPVLALPPAVSESVPLNDAAPVNLGPVLAATDFSNTSARALRWAADLAQEIASPLLLVHVVEPIAVAPQWQPYIEEADRARVADARAQMEKLTKQFAGSVECESLVESGPPADSIASIADQRRARVIVMGLASSPWPLGSRPGSIAYRVLCLAKTPVLVVPPQSLTESPQQ
jgi:nucleotide-binding universal stress UspA family protein